ncbi:MAG: hypothetical protein J3T61_12075 [Candidatus Brocadiales bacterium]|nr:hypothetical protein [Candidatus Bathyanammoxibius sp.]
MANDRPSVTKIILPILATAVFGAYSYTWAVHTMALSGDKETVVLVTEQAKEIKKDLNARIERMEKRVIQALKDLAKKIEANPLR